MNEKLLKIKQWIEVIRDIGLIIGIPALFVIGAGLYERQIDALKAEKKLLKLSQYDRAWTQLENQKNLFESERENFESRIKEYKNADQLKIEEIIQLKAMMTKLEESKRSYEYGASITKLILGGHVLDIPELDLPDFDLPDLPDLTDIPDFDLPDVPDLSSLEIDLQYQKDISPNGTNETIND